MPKFSVRLFYESETICDVVVEAASEEEAKEKALDVPFESCKWEEAWVGRVETSDAEEVTEAAA